MTLNWLTLILFEDSDTAAIGPIKGHWTLQPKEIELVLHL